MEKILSARVDEAVLFRLNLLSRTMKKSKKSIIEEAIVQYAEKVAKENCIDVLDLTLGTWRREDSPIETIRNIRKTFRDSQERYRR